MMEEERERERERELLLKEVQEWIAIENVCQSPEVMQLIWQLEMERHAYPQLVVNVDEN